MNLRAAYQSGAHEESLVLSTQPNLLERLKRREPDAQELVFLAENRRLQGLAKHLLGSAGDVPPLVADVFTDFFYSYVDRLQSAGAVSAYLRIMTVRRARRLMQQRSRQDDITAHTLAAAEGSDVIDALDAKAWLPWLEECSARLPERAHTILKLHFGHELGPSEIGAELGISKQAVSKTIQKCIAQLRLCLESMRARVAEKKGRA
jgi:RNA polymerase sigma factor (sigma-70 family)